MARLRYHVGRCRSLTSVVATAVVLSGFLLLVVAAARHLRWRSTFTRQLRAQHLWPEGWAGVVAWSTIGAEVAVGVGGVLALSGDSSAASLVPLLVASVLLGAGFLGIQIYLLIRLPDAPCGCDPASDATVGAGSLLKAGWPVVAGAVGLVALPTEGLVGLSLSAGVVAVIAGLGIASLVDALPALIR